MWDVIKGYGLISQWFGLGALGIVAAMAVIVYFPLFRSYAIAAIVLIVAFLGIYGKGVHDNAVLAKAQQAAANKAAVKRGTNAHTRAARDAAHGVRDPRDTDND